MRRRSNWNSVEIWIIIVGLFQFERFWFFKHTFWLIGQFVPPMLIFPRKNNCDLLGRGAPAGSLIRVHPSGWVQTHLFTEWFRHFIQTTNPSEKSPVLLILDGHFSHTRNLDVIEEARKNHVIIISLPPHTTHKLQPLDRAYMSPFKTYYSEQIRLFFFQKWTYSRSIRHRRVV